MLLSGGSLFSQREVVVCGWFGFSGEGRCPVSMHTMPCGDSYLDMLVPGIPGLWWGWEHAVPDHLALAPIAAQPPMVGLCSDSLGAGLGLSMAWWPFCLFYPPGVIGCSGYLGMLPGSVWWL